MLTTQGAQARLRGTVIVVGAAVRECFAAVAVTETAREADLADRLRVLDAAFERIERTQIEDRVERAGSELD
jgi:hypothetical protein